jgi:uncharacterized membrane protein YhaH (DUF805 family)
MSRLKVRSLLNFVPFVGFLILVVFLVLGGTNGENRFGPDPKAEPVPA